MSLEDWQKILQQHFTELRGKRPKQFPIFALEHGLSLDSKLYQLQKELQDYIIKGEPSDEHWLAWIVYASEIGYLYSGEEYWQTFENLTPGWDSGDRDWIRNCFKRFHTKFGGAEPKGAWAQHFSIICWPITHAILPQDLQYQLAKVLYAMSLTLRREFLESPDLLGKQIEAFSWDANSRFKVFVQEHLLVGQIATALLSDEEQQGTLILPQTLTRIVSDLERERQARYWLKSAKRAMRQVKFYGTQKGNITKAGGFIDDLDENSRKQFPTLGIEPYVILRPTTSTSWEVVIEIPNLSPLLNDFPQFKAVLSDLRCVVAGSSGRPLARGRLLLDSQRVVIQEWPEPSEPLLQFEQQLPSELGRVLKTYCFLRPGPDWLFRIQSDGFAYEVRSKVVRPGQSYILLTTEKPDQSIIANGEIHISCTGVHATRLDLPRAISSELEEQIENLGLSLAKSLQIWPAGFPAANWDGEGHGEWLSLDRPIFGVSIDHEVGGLVLNLDDSENLEIYSLEPRESLFVELPTLSPGYHLLSISVLSKGSNLKEQSGQVEIIIREPRAWLPRLTFQNPFMVLVDPVAPTLEQLWEERIRIEIKGPKTRSVMCSITLWSESSTPLITISYPMQLPVDASSWKRDFNKYFRKSKEVQRNYDLAEICQMDFDAADIGRYTLRCEREFTPIRWIVKHDGQRYALNLANYAETNYSLQLYRHDFSTPDIGCRLEGNLISLDPKSIDAGGMYFARVGAYQSSIILPRLLRKLEDLGVSPRLKRRSRSPTSVIELVNLFEVWAKARLPGNIVTLSHQLRVLNSINQGIFFILCGEKWGETEKKLETDGSQRALDDLKQLIAVWDRDFSVNNFSVSDIENFCAVSIRKRVLILYELAKNLRWFPRLSKIISAKGIKFSGRDYKASIRLPPMGLSTWLAEFALRLASCPETLQSWSGSNFTSGIENLFENPVIARAGRFLVLAVHRHAPPGPVVGERLYHGWEWE